MILVLDASVVVKWFNKEDYTDIALKLRNEFYEGRHELVVPDLLLLEVANALRYNNEITSDDAKGAVASLKDMELSIVLPSLELIGMSIEIAKAKNITVYDAIYVALAKLLDCKLVTADKELSEKAGKDFSVLQLKDL